jgi:hypothetical protein
MKTIEKPEKAYENTFFSKKAVPLRVLNRVIDATIKIIAIKYFCF